MTTWCRKLSFNSKIIRMLCKTKCSGFFMIADSMLDVELYIIIDLSKNYWSPDCSWVEGCYTGLSSVNEARYFKTCYYCVRIHWTIYLDSVMAEKEHREEFYKLCQFSKISRSLLNCGKCIWNTRELKFTFIYISKYIIFIRNVILHII